MGYGSSKASGYNNILSNMHTPPKTFNNTSATIDALGFIPSRPHHFLTVDEFQSGANFKGMIRNNDLTPIYKPEDSKLTPLQRRAGGIVRALQAQQSQPAQAPIYRQQQQVQQQQQQQVQQQREVIYQQGPTPAPQVIYQQAEPEPIPLNTGTRRATQRRDNNRQRSILNFSGNQAELSQNSLLGG